MKHRLPVSNTAYIMLLALAGLFAVLAVLGLLISLLIVSFERPGPYLAGLFLGAVSSAAKIVLMDKSLGKSLDMAGGHAKAFATLHVLARHGLTILVLLAAVFLPAYVGVFGVVLGVLALQLTAYIANYVLSKRPEWL